MAITSSESARRCNKQHKKPCHDCPWRRVALPGWLGGAEPTDWIADAHGEARIACHTVVGDPQPQCVGAAIYRANNHKLPRDRTILRAEANHDTVFSSPGEFMEHHVSLQRKPRSSE